MKFRCGSSNCRLINSREKNAQSLVQKNSHQKKYGKKHYRNDQKIYATYLRQYTIIFQQLNLPNILTKPKCIPSKKRKGFEFTKYLYNLFLLIT